MSGNLLYICHIGLFLSSLAELMELFHTKRYRNREQNDESLKICAKYMIIKNNDITI